MELDDIIDMVLELHLCIAVLSPEHAFEFGNAWLRLSFYYLVTTPNESLVM